jgi:hypothetical protein
LTSGFTDAQIQIYLDDAVLMVEHCVGGWTEARYWAIVRWVTAYLMDNISKGGAGGLASDSLGDASRSYFTGALGAGLAENGYGLKALALDTTGCLQRIGKGKATVEVI